MIIERRRLLGLGLATATAGLTPALDTLQQLAHPTAPSAVDVGLRPALDDLALSPASAPAPRRAYLHNIHTGEWLDEVYFENGAYVPGALAAASRVLRDWRNGEEHFIDPRLFDLLHTLRNRIEATAPFQIISGYRSPQTNAMLHDRSHEVASGSQHLLGKALDIRIEGVDLGRLHDAALHLRAGGVGYYPTSDFVHVDVGRVREWGGT